MKKQESKNKTLSVLQAFVEHKDVLAGYLAQRMIRSEDVDDLLQETFLLAYKAEQKGKIVSPKGYLFIIARNLLSKSYAKQAKEMTRVITDAEFENLEASEVPADRQLHYKLKMSALEKAIITLPPQCRRVFVMRKMLGLTQKQIATKLSISPSTVERHITIALSRLNDIMKKEGYNQEHTPAHPITPNLEGAS